MAIKTRLLISGAVATAMMLFGFDVAYSKPDRAASVDTGRSRNKVGLYESRSCAVRVTGYYRERPGNIGGPTGSRSIRIHTYGGKIIVTARPGHLLGPGSTVTFNSRVRSLRGVRRRGGKRVRPRRDGFFAEARAVGTTGVDLTVRSFHMPLWVKCVTKDRAGKVSSVVHRLVIAADPSSRQRLLVKPRKLVH